MLDYKDIIIKHYGLGLSGREIAKQLCASKSGVNDFLTAFEKCETLSFPLPDGITNYAIANHVYGDSQPSHTRDEAFASPNFEDVHKQMQTPEKHDPHLLVEPLPPGLHERGEPALPVPAFL